MGGEWCRRGGSNSRPIPYQGIALPLSYTGNVLTQAESECRLHACLRYDQNLGEAEASMCSWSRHPASNWRPQKYEFCALPTELYRHCRTEQDAPFCGNIDALVYPEGPLILGWQRTSCRWQRIWGRGLPPSSGGVGLSLGSCGSYPFMSSLVAGVVLVESGGIEPPTSCMPCRRSPS